MEGVVSVPFGVLLLEAPDGDAVFAWPVFDFFGDDVAVDELALSAFGVGTLETRAGYPLPVRYDVGLLGLGATLAVPAIGLAPEIMDTPAFRVHEVCSSQCLKYLVGYPGKPVL